MLFLSVALLVALVVVGCGNEPRPTAAPLEATHPYPPPLNDPAEVAASLTAMPDEDAAAPAEEPDEPAPTEAVAAEPQVDNCVECHTNQDTLIDTADPVAEVVSENEGEG